MDPNILIQNLAAKLQEIRSSKKRDTPALAEVLKSDYLNSITEDEEFKNALIPLLPEGQQTLEDLKLNLKSPQFLQALDSLEYALNSEAGYSVLMSMGIDPKIFYENGGDGNDALYKGLEKMWKK